MKSGRAALLTLCISVIVGFCSTPPASSESQQEVVLVNPSPAQKRTKPDLSSARNAYGSIQAAIDSQPVGPVYVYLPCGTYMENIVITTPDVRIEGAERACVVIEPEDPSLPVIDINSTNTGGIDFDEVSDLTLFCPAGNSCADGLRITGRTDIQQRNDFHKFSRLGIYGAFENGIDLTGRTIWTVFENIEVEYARNNGINVASSGTTNELTFRNVRTAWNYGYGIYLNNTQVNLANGITFDVVNAEYNGQNTKLANCAGIYLSGVSQANIENSYFEGNCEGNTADNTAAEVRITGTYAQSVNIKDSVFNLQYGEGGIYNDAFLTTGTYDGNKFTTTTHNFTIYIATSHPKSDVLIGENFNSVPTIVPDGNGFSHVRTLSPFGLDYEPVTQVSGEALDVSNSGGVVLYNGPYTISYLTGGHIGQIVDVTALNVSGHVLTNAAGGDGQIVFPDGMNRTLNAGESLLLYFDGHIWRPIEGNLTDQSRFAVSITTTAASSDTVSVPGIAESAHCTFSPRNAIAASMSGVYLLGGSGALTLSHAPVAGGIFDVFCSAK